MLNNKIKLWSLLDALGVLGYVALVAWFMNNSKKFFGEPQGVLSGVVILMIFVFSALVTSSLVLGRPIMLYLDGKKTEAVKMLFYTAASLFILLLLAIVGLLLLK